MSTVDSITVELATTEQRIAKIKSEIDQFDEKYRRISSGFGDSKLLNENYHNLILSTKDLSSHLDTIQRAIKFGAQNPDLRARAHNLNSQAINQLRRLQKLGTDVQQYVRVQVDKDKNFKEKLESPFTDFISNDKPSANEQKQISLESDKDRLRAQEMEQLESDIVQVNELFTTLATYIHDQGSLVDSIGNNIEVAYEQVHTGTDQLTKATKHRKSARRKKCICIGISIVILAIIALALGLSFKK